MRIELSDKLALVCASTRGLGYSCAEGLVTAGCDVIITGRYEETLSEAKAKLSSAAVKQGHAVEIHTLKVDLDDRAAVQKLIGKLAEFGDIDILICNSGGPTPGNFESFSDVAEFENKCSMITYSATCLMKYVIPKMKKKMWGRIINISSIGLLKPITGLAVSNASRAYLAALMTGVANENARHGITVNTILPGIIWTDRQAFLTQNEADAAGISYASMLKKKAEMIPSGTIGKPSDVGNIAVFLASEYSGYVNGQAIAVDGGLLGLLR